MTFALTGDTGDGGVHRVRICNQIWRWHQHAPLAAVFLLGDNLYSDTPFAKAIRKNFLEPFDLLLKANIPFHAVLGNHDYSGQYTQDEIDFAPLGMDHCRYYARTYGDGLVTFLMLDSETLDDDPDQLAWLRNQLDGSHSLWRVILLHEPVYCGDLAHRPAKKLRRLLDPIMSGEADVDLVVSGHNHVYERMELRQGVQHITVGSGGKLDADDNMTGITGQSVGYNKRRAFLLLTFQGTRLRGQTINEDGAVIDDFTLEDLEGPPDLRLSSDSPPATVPRP
jgi:predicted phosphodiesterase